MSGNLPDGWDQRVRLRNYDMKCSPRHLTEDDIRRLVCNPDQIRTTLRDAEGSDKSDVYRALGLALAYNPGQKHNQRRGQARR
jgi:hypothetical protein